MLCYDYKQKSGIITKKIRVYLPQPVFTHGQLYVALYRATSLDSIKVLINTNEHNAYNLTKNVVFRDLLGMVKINEIHIITKTFAHFSHIHMILNIITFTCL